MFFSAKGGRAQGRKTFQTRSVVAFDTYGCVQGKPAIMLICCHLVAISLIDQAAPDKEAKNSPSNDCLNLAKIDIVKSGSWMKNCGSISVGRAIK